MGHRITAQIAYDELDAETRIEVDRLLRIPVAGEPGIDDFVAASLWMDEIRSKGWRAFDHWHYTNLPFNDDGLSAVPSADPHGVVWAIQQAASTLANPKAGEAQKAWALRMLLHLVGDIHQPLHCVSRYSLDLPRGDRGGNLFLLADEKNPNLHRLWDGMAGLFSASRTQRGRGSSIRYLADELRQRLPRTSLAPQHLNDPEAWARESFSLALEVVYQGLEPGGKPSQEYLESARRAIERRLVQGGYRLADLLEVALKRTDS